MKVVCQYKINIYITLIQLPTLIKYSISRDFKYYHVVAKHTHSWLMIDI